MREDHKKDREMVAYTNSPLNHEAAHKYVTALGAMIANSAPRELSNPREAALIAVPAGKELELHEAGYTRERDVIAIAFRPGQESEGPTNIAIYERLNNKVRVNPRCSSWYSPHPRLFIIASHEDETGYGYSNGHLVRIGPVPRHDLELRIKQGKAELHRAAQVAKDLVSDPFRRR